MEGRPTIAHAGASGGREIGRGLNNMRNAAGRSARELTAAPSPETEALTRDRDDPHPPSLRPIRRLSPAQEAPSERRLFRPKPSIAILPSPLDGDPSKKLQRRLHQ